MERDLLTEKDLHQLRGAGIPFHRAQMQIEFLKKGVKPLHLNRPCTVGDGIDAVAREEQAKLVALHDEAARRGRVMKFVPASGAASRMFTHWHGVMEKGCFEEETAEKHFIENIGKLAFYSDLADEVAQKGGDIKTLLQEKKFDRILACLFAQGMNYGGIPKALIKFHAYPEGGRTALEEHLVEAALYTADAQGICRLHFTVSEEYMGPVESFIGQVKERYEKTLGVNFRIGLSSQHSSTNTVAMEGKGMYRNGDGALILRPGGHGALLENLNNLEGDIILVKNIDNIVPDRLKPVTVLYKKVLAGYLISIQEEIFGHMGALTGGKANAETVGRATLFCQESLKLSLPVEFDGLPLARQAALLAERLNRPLRVCGMVRNEGEPGGGPFWVDDAEGQTRQIVESQQIDPDSKGQKKIWEAATHFNPVDLACSIRDYRGCKFNLHQYTDPEAVVVSRKSEKGRDITIMEHPGLWNGSMAKWNTLFVEVPIETFNPVKTVHDLLRPCHLPENC